MSTRALMVLGMVFFMAIIEEGKSILICNTDTNELEKCRGTVTSDPPPKPTKECCRVITHSDLSCLCKFKSYLPTLGLDPAKATALGPKCGISNLPPPCKA